MHILLTDLLSCPRCGPAFGLILLADRIADRRVMDGLLGCANCREKYPISGGYGELGTGARLGDGPPAGEDAAIRLAGMLGVTEGPGFVLLLGAPAAHAEVLADMIPELEVIAAAGEARAWSERPGVSRIGVDHRLPFYDRKLRGVALAGVSEGELLEEAVRVLAPLARLVLQDVPAAAAERVRGLGLKVLAQQGDTLVAARG